MARAVELVLDARLGLGECPRWHPIERALYFVDVPGRALHRLDPATGEHRIRGFDAQCACFAFRRGRGFVLGMEDGFAVIDDFDAPLRLFGEQLEAARSWSRLNDGRTDLQGRFWAGAMDTSKQHHDARLFRLDPDGQVSVHAEGALTSNGAAVSPDGRTLYYSDTPEHVIYAYDLDPASGEITNRREFHRFPQGHGRPDGGSVDAEGCYWAALFEGGRVVRLSPAGEILEEVAIPASRVTMPAFGGEDGRTVYVTTAREKLTQAELAAQPLAGAVFSFRADVEGLPETPFVG